MGILRSFQPRLGMTIVSGLSLVALAGPAGATAPFPIFRSPAGPEADVRVEPPAGGRGIVVIAVSNAGDADLALTPPSSPTVWAPIAVQPAGRMVLRPGELKHLVITCDPAPVGSVVQTLLYATNDPIEPVLVYTVTCTGRTPLSELTALIREVPSFNLKPELEASVLGKLVSVRSKVLAGDKGAVSCPVLKSVLAEIAAAADPGPSHGAGTAQGDTLMKRVGGVISLLAC
jgi:hypothetical protein